MKIKKVIRLVSQSPCPETKHLRKWAKKQGTLKRAWERCKRGDWMVEYIEACTRSDVLDKIKSNELRRKVDSLIQRGCDCACDNYSFFEGSKELCKHSRKAGRELAKVLRKALPEPPRPPIPSGRFYA